MSRISHIVGQTLANVKSLEIFKRESSFVYVLTQTPTYNAHPNSFEKLFDEPFTPAVPTELLIAKSQSFSSRMVRLIESKAFTVVFTDLKVKEPTSGCSLTDKITLNVETEMKSIPSGRFAPTEKQKDLLVFATYAKEMMIVLQKIVHTNLTPSNDELQYIRAAASLRQVLQDNPFKKQILNFSAGEFSCVASDLAQSALLDELALNQDEVSGRAARRGMEYILSLFKMFRELTVNTPFVLGSLLTGNEDKWFIGPDESTRHVSQFLNLGIAARQVACSVDMDDQTILVYESAK